MSRYRKILCKIWNDETFSKLTEREKLVCFQIHTSPLSNSFGLYKASLHALAEELNISISKYKKAFQKVIDVGFFVYDFESKVVFIPKFLQDNPPANPNVVISWGKHSDWPADYPVKI